jgi:hypothetical protein
MNSRGTSGRQVAKDNQEAAMESNKQKRTDRNAALYQKSELYKSAWDKDGITTGNRHYRCGIPTPRISKRSRAAI